MKDMKSLKCRWGASLAAALVVLVFLGIQEASAYYDPGVQRWINRDPRGEAGGHNLNTFLLNSPMQFFDSWGLQWQPTEPLASPRDMMKELLGPGKLCTAKGCDQSKCGKEKGQHLPENYEVDSRAGRDPWRELPSPGECAASDLIATPRGRVKIPNGVTCTIECDPGGNPYQLVCKKRSILAPNPILNPGPEHRFPKSPYEQ
jgi:hypothetical protein